MNSRILPLTLFALLLCAGTASAQNRARGSADPKAGDAIGGLLCLGCSGLTCLAVVAGAIGGLVFLLRPKKELPPQPLDMNNPNTFDRDGVRFQHPRAWSVKPGLMPMGPRYDVRGPQLGFFTIGLAGGAGDYTAAFLKGMDEEIAAKEKADESPEDIARMREHLQAGDNAQRMADASRKGFAEGVANALIKHSAEALGCSEPEKTDAVESGTLCGKPAMEYTFSTAGRGRRYTGACRYAQVGDNHVLVMWMVPENAESLARPGIDLVQRTLKAPSASALK